MVSNYEIHITALQTFFFGIVLVGAFFCIIIMCTKNSVVANFLRLFEPKLDSIFFEDMKSAVDIFFQFLRNQFLHKLLYVNVISLIPGFFLIQNY